MIHNRNQPDEYGSGPFKYEADYTALDKAAARSGKWMAIIFGCVLATLALAMLDKGVRQVNHDVRTFEVMK